MDADLENKAEKLCLRYLKAQADISLCQPVELTTGRSRRRAQAQVVNLLVDLQRTRRGPVASLVKLAYVRGLRSLRPGAKLSDQQLEEVDFLARRLDYDLRKLESRAIASFRSQIRRLKLVSTLEGFDYPPTTLEALAQDKQEFPLEQYARESIRTIMSAAYDAGVSAASYDGGANADG